MNYHFLFLIHAQGGKAVLSTNNYFFILIFYGAYYIHSNNKNTTATPSLEFGAYFPPKAMFQIQDWARSAWEFLKPSLREIHPTFPIAMNPQI